MAGWEEAPRGSIATVSTPAVETWRASPLGQAASEPDCQLMGQQTETDQIEHSPRGHWEGLGSAGSRRDAEPEQGMGRAGPNFPGALQLEQERAWPCA